MKNYLIVHGSYATNIDNWLPWLEKKLTDAGEEVINLNYPTHPNPVEAAEVQNYENWAKVLNTVKDRLNEDTIFVGHSISNIFFVKYCIENNIHISKAIFVSGFTNYNNNYTKFVDGFVKQVGYDFFDKAMNTFYPKHPEQFKELAKSRICFFSDDDPIVSQAKLKEFAKLMGAESICMAGAGHFCNGAYSQSFEEILPYLDCLNVQADL